MKIALAGLGAIGGAVARRVLADGIPGIQLVAVSARDHDKARATLKAMKGGAVPVVGLADLAGMADLVIECAPAALMDEIAQPVLRAGKKLLVLSAGALLPRPELLELAKKHGGQIIVPSGALLGLDAVCAAAEGQIHSVQMTTRKPPKGLTGAPYLVENRIQVDNVREPLRVFSGSARDAAKGFPANVNVAVALSLAGIGPDRTRIDIWADPSVTRNTHRIQVESDSARIDMTIENIPSENPKTGRITALSVIAALRKIHAPLRVGT
ncbi:MAG TPA: aspartate dehydrogenase [Burkholderiales bacterium]|nr:aspartate dehydrogenase [Burkholderiales bacterium]